MSSECNSLSYRPALALAGNTSFGMTVSRRRVARIQRRGVQGGVFMGHFSRCREKDTSHPFLMGNICSLGW